MKITEAQIRNAIKKAIKENDFDLSTKQGQEDFMWNRYGNRSVVPVAGCNNADDTFTRSHMDSGELAMQAQMQDDDIPDSITADGTPEGAAWRKNGQSRRWGSPTGDVRLKESEMRNLVRDVIRETLLKENYPSNAQEYYGDNRGVPEPFDKRGQEELMWDEFGNMSQQVDRIAGEYYDTLSGTDLLKQPHDKPWWSLPMDAQDDGDTMEKSIAQGSDIWASKKPCVYNINRQRYYDYANDLYNNRFAHDDDDEEREE